MTDNITPQPPANDLAVQILSDEGAQCGDCGDQPGDRICPACEKCRRNYVLALRAAGWGPTGALIGEVQRLHAELAKYVGAEPTIAEEMTYLSRCLNDVHAVCDGAEEKSLRWENPLPVPEWVPVVREAAEGQRAENPNDRRRRVYIDGKGNGWIDLNQDEATGEHNVTGLTDQWQIKTTDEITADTGTLREIGRCW